MIMELWARVDGIVPGAAEQTQESPGLDFAIDGNWIQECTDQNRSQNNNRQSPLQMPTMKEESETLLIPQL